MSATSGESECDRIEQVWRYASSQLPATELPDGHVLYALFVAPAQDYTALSRTFQSMVASLHVNDRSAHGGQY